MNKSASRDCAAASAHTLIRNSSVAVLPYFVNIFVHFKFPQAEELPRAAATLGSWLSTVNFQLPPPISNRYKQIHGNPSNSFIINNLAFSNRYKGAPSASSFESRPASRRAASNFTFPFSSSGNMAR
jgi:hypothetical protein